MLMGINVVVTSGTRYKVHLPNDSGIEGVDVGIVKFSSRSKKTGRGLLIRAF